MEEGPFKPNCSLSETLQKKDRKGSKTDHFFVNTEKRHRCDRKIDFCRTENFSIICHYIKSVNSLFSSKQTMIF